MKIIFICGVKMESCLIKMKSLHAEMGRSEKKIADYILAHPNEIVSLSISELAKRCGAGDATVVRFARRLGLSGFSELKISIARQIGGESERIGISEADNCHDIFIKRISEVDLALEKTGRVLDSDELQKAAQGVLEARRILIFGLGNSAAIAIDAQHKLLRAGLNAVAYSDNHMQAIAASHTTPADMAIGISHSGASRDVVAALRICRERGATTVCITNFGMSPIAEHSDIVLNTNADETKYSILALSSRIAQLAIIDAIYSYAVLHLDDSAVTAINETESSLLEKKL